jgi:O-antigen/teichoic acid export membrane protein
MRTYGNVNRYTSLVALPLFAGLGVSAPSLVPILLGDAWRPAVPLVQILACGAMVQFVFLFTPTAVSALGRPDLVFATSAITVVAVLLGFLLLRPVNPVAATWIWVARSAVGGPIGLIVLWKLLDLSPFGFARLHVAPAFASLAMAAALAVADHFVLADAMAPALRLCLLVPAGALIYVETMALLRGRAFTDLLQNPARLFSP